MSGQLRLVTHLLATKTPLQEQLDVERWFVNTTGSIGRAVGSSYFIGAEHASGARYRWFLVDGTYIGTGEPNNGDPYYAHW